MATIHPHINFNGNAEEAFGFYKSVFGGEFGTITRFKDVPGMGEHMGEDEVDKLMRITLPIGTGMLVGNDVPSFMGKTNENENRSKILVTADNREEADKIFKGLSVGGVEEMTPEDNPGATYFAMFRDKYGIEWEIESNS